MSWVQGQCWGCLDRHYYDDTDPRPSTTPRDAKDKTKIKEEVTNDSPYQGFKIVKEVEKIRREEVDLETGRKRSFTEVVEYEVLDLTKQRTPFAVVGSSNSTQQGLGVFKFPEVDVKQKASQGAENTPEDSVIIVDSPKVAAKLRTPSRARPRIPSLRV